MPQNKHEIQLYETQQRAGQGILEELNRGEAKLILLEGLSGVGKDTVLDAHRLNIEANGGVITEPHYLISGLDFYNKKRLEDILSDKIFVSAVTPREKKLVLETMSCDFPDLKKVSHILQGLSLDEITDYIHIISKNRKIPLSIEQLALYSMGIPLLSKVLLADQNINLNQAAFLSATYLMLRAFNEDRYFDMPKKGIDRRMLKYLQIKPPQEILDIVKGNKIYGNYEHIYGRLAFTLNSINILKERGIEIESPLFVSHESVGIYNKMLNTKSINPWIDIFVPSLNHEDFNYFLKNLGVPENFHLLRDRIDWSFLPDMSYPLLRTFGADNRKVNLWFRDKNGEEYATGGYPWSEYTSEYAIEFEKRFYDGGFPIKPTSNEVNKRRLLIHSHDHENLVFNPTLIGYMMESQLQQLGVAYIVDNRLFGRMYFFNPEKRRIETIPK